MTENQVKIYELKWWFDNYYTRQEQKLRRLCALNKLCDDRTLPDEALKRLYEEAEEKRKEIQKLEKQESL